MHSAAYVLYSIIMQVATVQISYVNCSDSTLFVSHVGNADKNFSLTLLYLELDSLKEW